MIGVRGHRIDAQTPETRRLVAEGLACDCGFLSLEAMRHAVGRLVPAVTGTVNVGSSAPDNPSVTPDG